MSLLHLEEFALTPPGGARGAEPGAESDATAEAGLLAFERGYREGWDDCRRAAATADAALREDVAAHLRQMQTGLAEARAQILAALGPLFRGMVEKVLPAMARDALVPVIVERLQALAQDLAGQPLSIRIHPGAHDTAAEMLAGFPAAFSLSDDPALGPGQALLALPDRERMIDLDGVIAAIGEAMDAYLHNHGAEAPRQGVIQDA